MARLNRLAPQPPAIRPTGEAYGVLKEQFGVTGSREGGSGALAEPVAVLRIKLPCRFRLVNLFGLPDLVGGSSEACAGVAELREPRRAAGPNLASQPVRVKRCA